MSGNRDARDDLPNRFPTPGGFFRVDFKENCASANLEIVAAENKESRWTIRVVPLGRDQRVHEASPEKAHSARVDQAGKSQPHQSRFFTTLAEAASQHISRIVKPCKDTFHIDLQGIVMTTAVAASVEHSHICLCRPQYTLPEIVVLPFKASPLSLQGMSEVSEGCG